MNPAVRSAGSSGCAGGGGPVVSLPSDDSPRVPVLLDPVSPTSELSLLDEPSPDEDDPRESESSPTSLDEPTSVATIGASSPAGPEQPETTETSSATDTRGVMRCG